MFLGFFLLERKKKFVIVKVFLSKVLKIKQTLKASIIHLTKKIPTDKNP